MSLTLREIKLSKQRRKNRDRHAVLILSESWLQACWLLADSTVYVSLTQPVGSRCLEWGSNDWIHDLLQGSRLLYWLEPQHSPLSFPKILALYMYVLHKLGNNRSKNAYHLRPIARVRWSIAWNYIVLSPSFSLKLIFNMILLICWSVCLGYSGSYLYSLKKILYVPHVLNSDKIDFAVVLILFQTPTHLLSSFSTRINWSLDVLMLILGL